MIKIDWRTEWPLWLIIAGMLIASGVFWPDAPDEIPVHWNIHGEVDRYGGTFEGLFLMPLVTLGVYLLMIFLPKIDPGRANYPVFRNVYTMLRFGLVLIFAVLHTSILIAIKNPGFDVGHVVPYAIGLFFIVFGNVMGKIRPNWFVGIKTPWTLSSKRSWTRTHRFGGRLFMVIGLVVILTGIVKQDWMFIIMTVTVIGGVVLMFAYSYLVWKKDPDRIPAAGSEPVKDEAEPEK